MPEGHPAEFEDIASPEELEELEKSRRLLFEDGMPDKALNNFFCSLPGGMYRGYDPDIRALRTPNSLLNKSWDEYFRDIDAVIEQLDLSQVAISGFQTIIRPHGIGDSDDHLEFGQYVFPVFERLVCQYGYAVKDLRS